MTERKTRVTVTIDPRLVAYANELVEAGKADSVSAVLNGALAEREARDREALRRIRDIAAQADPEKVARMRAHVDAQLAALPASHRRR